MRCSLSCQMPQQLDLSCVRQRPVLGIRGASISSSNLWLMSVLPQVLASADSDSNEFLDLAYTISSIIIYTHTHPAFTDFGVDRFCYAQEIDAMENKK